MTEYGGKRCQICIGCGRCAPGAETLHVVTESFLRSESGSECPAEMRACGQRAGLHPEGRKGDFVLTDIGTTTIAMELYDMQGRKKAQHVCANPQRIFGADVISRIQAAENVLQRRQMQTQVRSVLEEGIREFDKQSTGIERMYIAANTTMLYLLCGHDPGPLGYAPFRADYLESERLRIGGTEAVTLPGFSAFVGADVLSGVLACGMGQEDKLSLLIDLGTNGEMVLGNRTKMVATSTAAGPAFEGMLQKDRKAVWGADIVDIAAGLLTHGIIDETGLLTDAYFETGIQVADIRLSQEQIRQLQTAKAAVAAGIQMLMNAYGIRSMAEIDRVYLAGGFGYFLKEESAIRIGLLPKASAGKIVAAGNTALAGAYAYHYDETADAGIKEILAHTQVINLAETDGFSEQFVENMYLRSF